MSLCEKCGTVQLVRDMCPGCRKRYLANLVKEKKEPPTYKCKECKRSLQNATWTGEKWEHYHGDSPPKQEPPAWEERYERSFNQKHGSNHHALAADGKRSKDCATCQEDRKYNPKGYYLTYLTEGKHYWNREMMEDVKSFIRSILASERQKLWERVVIELQRQHDMYKERACTDDTSRNLAMAHGLFRAISIIRQECS